MPELMNGVHHERRVYLNFYDIYIYIYICKRRRRSWENKGLLQSLKFLEKELLLEPT